MAPDEYIGRTKMTYKMIESNMFHQIVRDGICVLRTADTLDTANTLARFVASMDTLIVKTDVVEITAPLPDKFEQAPPDLELLKVNHVKTDHEVACEMWSSFKGITAATADEYMRMWSIGDIVCGEISRADIEGFRTSGGEIRILSKIPGVSQATASQLMTANSLRQIAKFSVGALSIQKIGASKKNLGEVRAKKILDMLWYRPQVAQPAPAARIDDAELAEMISTIGI
jgi:ERCC4-type nuclease